MTQIEMGTFMSCVTYDCSLDSPFPLHLKRRPRCGDGPPDETMSNHWRVGVESISPPVFPSQPFIDECDRNCPCGTIIFST
nr:hypothetical protein BgiMline_000793 [Biomphalaria glabrata]